MTTVEKRHIISILVENEFGSLSRIAGLFSARGYNIHCLSVAPTSDDSISRMTLVTYCSDAKSSQLMKQLAMASVQDEKVLDNFIHLNLAEPEWRRFLYECFHNLELWLELDDILDVIHGTTKLSLFLRPYLW